MIGRYDITAFQEIHNMHTHRDPLFKRGFPDTSKGSMHVRWTGTHATACHIALHNRADPEELGGPADKKYTARAVCSSAVRVVSDPAQICSL